MSPNGLRRWRRYAKKCRYRSRKEGKVSNATGASLRALFFAALIHPNYAVPPKPITARSLVGMSMGARKRAAHREAANALGKDRAHAYTCEYGSYLRSGEYLGAYWTARAKYRIGQRLRPCPGCHTCMPGVKGWHIDKVRGRFKVPTIAWSCDGSGILPARAKKVMR